MGKIKDLVQRIITTYNEADQKEKKNDPASGTASPLSKIMFGFSDMKFYHCGETGFVVSPVGTNEEFFKKVKNLYKQDLFFQNLVNKTAERMNLNQDAFLRKYYATPSSQLKKDYDGAPYTHVASTRVDALACLLEDSVLPRVFKNEREIWQFATAGTNIPPANYQEATVLVAKAILDSIPHEQIQIYYKTLGVTEHHRWVLQLQSENIPSTDRAWEALEEAGYVPIDRSTELFVYRAQVVYSLLNKRPLSPWLQKFYPTSQNLRFFKDIGIINAEQLIELLKNKNIPQFENEPEMPSALKILEDLLAKN